MDDQVITPQRPRRRFKLTLRLTMALILILGAGLGWVVHRARVQREAVKTVLKGSGMVGYNGQIYGMGPKKVATRPIGPLWLRKALGPDVFDSVTSVGFGFGSPLKMTDETFRAIGRLDRVEGLSLQGAHFSGVSREAMAEIRTLDRLIGVVVQGGADPAGMIAGLEGKAQLKSVFMPGANPTDADMAILAHLTWLDELLLDGRDNLTQRGFDRLAALKNLKTLNLFGGRISDISALSGLTKLTGLILGDSSEPPGPPLNLSPLRGLTRLTELSLGHNPVDDAQLRVLAEMKGLQMLEVRGAGITEATLPLLASLPKANSLDLLETSIQDVGLLGPKVFSLRRLELKGSSIGNDGLRALSRATLLRELGLAKTRIDDDGLQPLLGLNLLRELILDDTSVTDAGMARIRGLPALKQIRLARTRITDAGLAHLGAMTTLISIHLEGTGITDVGLVHLAKLPACEYLMLNGTAVTDAGIASLKGLRKLDWLDLARTKITDVGVSTLARMPSLTWIGLAGTAVTDVGLVELAKLPALRSVDLADTGVTDAGVARLRAARPGLMVKRGDSWTD